MRRFVYINFFFVLIAIMLCRLQAQTPPCGIAVIRADGAKVEDRFVPAPPQQLRSALLKALPALGMKVHKDKDLQIETKTDHDLLQSVEQANADAGVHGAMHGIAFGTAHIEIREATQEQVKGSQLHIEFDKPAVMGRAVNHGNDALPLAEETTCLAKVLSTNDLKANPRGLPVDESVPLRQLQLPEGTPLKVLLPDPLYSKKLGKDSIGQTVQFEVAEDVVTDGAIVIRRGALATGHYTDLKKGRSYGRHAEVDFAFDSVTAVDGQNIPLIEAGEKARGGRHNDAAGAVLSLGAFGFLEKGASAFVRAGTSYDVEISGDHTVKTGR